MFGDLETALPLLLKRLDEAVTQCERGLITSTAADCRLTEEVARAASDLADGPMGCSTATLRLVPLLVGRVREWADGRLCEDPEMAAEFRRWLGEWRDCELRRHRRFAETYAALDALLALGNRELVAVELERLRLLGTEANEDRLVQCVADAAEHFGIWEVLVGIIRRQGPPLGVVGHDVPAAWAALRRLAATDADAAAALEDLTQHRG